MVDVITSVFEITQTRLAEMMYCHKAKITRIKNGEETPTLGVEEIFANVFDPTNPRSAAKWEVEYCLSVVKEVIKSDFKEIYEAMADCWEEKDYKTFVLALLGRARQGASSEKQKRVSLDETPSAQISKIFEQAVADYNIAICICKLPDYLCGESFNAGDFFAFIDTIQTEVQCKFINQQNESVFKKISDFVAILESYLSFLGMIRLSISEEYGVIWKTCGSYDEVFCLIDNNYSKVKAEVEKKFKNSSDEFSTDEAETRLNQLNFLRSILLAYKQICKLYSEICTDKTLLVF